MSILAETLNKTARMMNETFMKLEKKKYDIYEDSQRA